MNIVSDRQALFWIAILLLIIAGFAANVLYAIHVDNNINRMCHNAGGEMIRGQCIERRVIIPLK